MVAEYCSASNQATRRSITAPANGPRTTTGITVITTTTSK